MCSRVLLESLVKMQSQGRCEKKTKKNKEKQKSPRDRIDFGSWLLFNPFEQSDN
jgi:hypothetical protein